MKALHNYSQFQLLLLQESWKDLFLLHFSQWSIPWDLGSVLSARQSQLQLSSSSLLSDDKITEMEIKTMMEIMVRFRQLSPDGTECGCLKAIVLFKPGEFKTSKHFVYLSKSPYRALKLVASSRAPDPSRPISILTILFSETTGLVDFHPVEMLQDQAQCILGDYVRNRHPRQPTRFGRLLLSIPLLRMIR